MTTKTMCVLRVSLAAIVLTSIAYAELQNVEVGGKIEIYGAYYSKFYEKGDGAARYPAATLRGRPLGPNGDWSIVRGNRDGGGYGFAEQRTRLHVGADFTEAVGAFIELDSVHTWGEDFRSQNYITGVDARATIDADNNAEVEVYQAYVQAEEMFGLPVRLRVGRQELEFGSGWLVGADPGPDPFTGLSFDAVRLTLETHDVTLDAWWSKLAENLSDFGQGDLDFYGIYASYAGLEGLTFDGYWMLVHDDVAIPAPAYGVLGSCLRDWLGYDDYEDTLLHTVGLRHAGEKAGFDWEAEVAYQWGEADALGVTFVPAGMTRGDTMANWNEWAAHAEIGYTIDVKTTPRLALAGAYYGGEDRRDISLRDWLNPFYKPQASVSFNRLFTSVREDWLMDYTMMSNFWKVYASVTDNPLDPLEIGLDLTYMEAVGAFRHPDGLLPFRDDKGAKDLGWQLGAWATYSYTEDLSFEVGYAHFFVGRGIADGVFVYDNGLSLVGGAGERDDADYAYLMTTLEF